MSDVYLSYARGDSTIAVRIAHELEKNAWRVFLDVDSLALGTDLVTQLKEEISKSKVVVVLLSKHSQQKSKLVQEEVRMALESNRHVIPVWLDSAARDNWIWPLIADRQAIIGDVRNDPADLIKKVTQAVNFIITVPQNAPMSEAEKSVDSGQMKGLSLWTWVIPLLTALLGAAGMWFVMR